MNDWHHADDDGKVVRIMGSRFYSEHQEYWVGDDGTDPTLPEFVRKPIARFQDFAIEDVRRLRIETAIEATQRYDIAGFEYDFMRCPGYFKYDQVEANIPVMTQFIRDTRKALDEIGKQKGKQIGLSVRVPNTIRGSINLGLDVPAWIDEYLVDIVVPSTFFNADLEEDISEWVELAASSPVRIIPAIEEGYSAGHTGGVTRCFYSPPVMLPLTHDMINAIAARHWRNGTDGIYVFNWFGTTPTYDYDNRLALDDIGNPLRLKYKNKRYVVMRTDHSFPNCLPDPRQLPVELSSNPLPVRIDIADDIVTAGSRVECVTMRVHYTNLTVADKIKISVNGSEIRCTSPIVPGSYVVYNSPWTNYDLASCLLKCGVNEIVFQVVERNRALEKELAITVEDIEISIEYSYPNGKWRSNHLL
jgi:hypothetical protein